MEREQTNIKLIEGLQLDIKNLLLEGKKKYPHVKEVLIKWYSSFTNCIHLFKGM